MADAHNRRLPPSGPPLGTDQPLVQRRHNWWWRHRRAIAGTVAGIVVAGGITTAVLATRNLGVVTANPTVDLSSFAPPKPTTSAPPSPTASPTASATAAAGTKATAKGKVVAVVAVDRWTVAVEQGLDLTVVASRDTKFAHNRSASDVRKGSTLSVVGTITAGVITATSVTISK